MDGDLLNVAMHWVVRVLEIGGAAVITFGAIVSTADFLRLVLARVPPEERFRSYRASLGRSILLGLELLVAADIIRTVTIEPTLTGVAVLGALILVRTFLSFSLEAEIDGRWPWQRASGGNPPGSSL